MPLDNFSKQRIRTTCSETGAQLTDLIDLVIEDNGVVGVGKITLAEQLSNYVLYGLFRCVPQTKEVLKRVGKEEYSPDLINSPFDQVGHGMTTAEKLQAKGYNLDELDKDNPYVYPYGEFTTDEDEEEE